jgi:hypothetical protein
MQVVEALQVTLVALVLLAMLAVLGQADLLEHVVTLAVLGQAVQADYQVALADMCSQHPPTARAAQETKQAMLW